MPKPEELYLVTNPNLSAPSLPNIYPVKPEFFPRQDLAEELAKAGFNPQLELKRQEILRHKFGRVKGDFIWISSLTDQIVEHAFEYSKKDLVRVPPPYQIVNNHLFSPRFAAFAHELVDTRERGGSVLKGIQKVEEKLISSPPNSFIIWVSPAGPLGINNLEYDYSWTHIFLKEEDSVKYVSIRTDFTLQEHAAFLNFFLSQQERINVNPNSVFLKDIQKILETPAVVTPQMGVRSLKELGEWMSVIRANLGGIAYLDKEDGQPRYFSQIIEDLSSETKQSDERQPIQSLIDYYENQLLKEDLSLDQKIEIIAAYLISVHYLIRKPQSHKINPKNYPHLAYYAYQEGLITTLQKIAGCGSVFVKQNTSTFTLSLIELSQTFTCPKCGYTTFERVGNKCPFCGLTKEEYAQELARQGKKTCS